MKKIISHFIVTGILMLVCFTLFSQDNAHKIPAWVSDKGYWVIENNLHQPLQHIIRFYNNENLMIGRKDISGTRLNLKKRKTKMQLKSMLESSLLVWAAQQSATGNADLAHKP